MSVKIHGIASGSYTPQSDFQSADNPNGGTTATQSYMIKAASYETLLSGGTFAKNTTASTLDPDLGSKGDRLYLDHISVQNVAGGFVRVVGHFAGFAASYDSSKAADPTYLLRAALKEQTILLHPQVIALELTDRLLLSGLFDGVYFWDGENSKLQVQQTDGTFTDTANQPTAADAVTFCEKIAAGWRTFLVPHLTWEKTWSDDDGITSTDFSNLGKIDTRIDGGPPNLGDDRDWMLTDATQQQTGQLYRNRLEWTASDRGGYDTDIYDYDWEQADGA